MRHGKIYSNPNRRITGFLHGHLSGTGSRDYPKDPKGYRIAGM